MLKSKWQPPKSLYYKNEFNMCTEPTTFDPLFLENINDVAETLIKVIINKIKKKISI